VFNRCLESLVLSLRWVFIPANFVSEQTIGIAQSV